MSKSKEISLRQGSINGGANESFLVCGISDGDITGPEAPFIFHFHCTAALVPRIFRPTLRWIEWSGEHLLLFEHCGLHSQGNAVEKEDCLELVGFEGSEENTFSVGW